MKSSRFRPTGKHLSDLLPKVMTDIHRTHKERPDLVIAAWAEVVGHKLAPMTAALCFEKGILVVKVNNSTLHSLLAQTERPNLLKRLREKFPTTPIHNIAFRVG